MNLNGIQSATAADIDAVLAAQHTLNLWGYDNPLMPRRLSISIELARCLDLKQERPDEQVAA